MKRPTGKLYTSSPSGLKHLDQESEIWQITRGKLMIPDAVLVRSLSPSDTLFNIYLNKWKDLSPEQWWPEYEELFLQELQSEDKLNNLRLLYKTLQSGKNVVLLCYCKDVRYCHRRLVGEFFKQYDIEAIELNLTEPEISKHQQLTIFDGVI
jgi:uncharacterized protein YeaO (DUF488 family)